MTDVRLELAGENAGEEVNVFIHGFGRFKGQYLETYLRMLRRIGLRGRTYLLNWRSGLIWRPLLPVALMAGGILGYSIYKKIKDGKAGPNPETPRSSLLKRIFKFGSPAFPVFPVAASLEFGHSKRRAEKVGGAFLTWIQDIPRIKEAPLNLIGFSLGARVIYHALHTQDWTGYHLKNVCLLGGAVDAYNSEWEECLPKLSGYLYNFYSKRDDALAVKPDKERNVGRYPIPLELPKVVNIETSLHHHRHPSYADNLPQLLQVLGPLPDAPQAG
jgi:hypothetical protein